MGETWTDEYGDSSTQSSFRIATLLIFVRFDNLDKSWPVDQAYTLKIEKKNERNNKKIVLFVE